MWEYLEKYLANKKVLEIGCGTGQKTANISKYAKEVVAIDISSDNIALAKERLNECKNTIFITMNASKLSFEDNSFDIIITTDSFHEIDPKIQSSVLSEMMRVSNLIIFVEPDEVSVTNELFKVFDSNEDHSLRIKNSMDLAFTTMKNYNYKLIEKGYYDDKTGFSSKKEMCETMLDWWNDIKVPANDSEKKQMIDKIEEILIEFDMLDKLEVFETIHYYVFERK